MRDNLREALLGINCMTFENAKVIADTIREVIDERIGAAKPQPAEPRRNPYEAWDTWSNGSRIFGIRDLHKARFDAWNEGAQIAGGRDE